MRTLRVIGHGQRSIHWAAGMDGSDHKNQNEP